ncbi:MAG TPA: hypothetical protein VLH10_09775, partial [Yinghuangia sp.]|nr:hypothetical protein [Yinghuangia sp.]
TAADAGVRTGAVGSWIAERRHALYIGVVALGGVWLLLWNHPTPGSVVLVAAVVLLVLVLLEIAAAASRGAPETPATWTAEDMESRTTGRTWPRNPPT